MKYNIYDMLEQYSDINIEEDLFPNGKQFRILFDNTQFKWRILSQSQFDLDQMIDAFSVPNPTAFYSKVYGYNANQKLYIVNKFGYFPIGAIFEILKYIKQNYGSLDVLAMSLNAKMFLKTFLTPLKDFTNTHPRDTFKISNISTKYELRDYQENAIKSIIFDGYGRGLLELPTGAGKSFVIANFIYTLQQQYDSGITSLIFVPNKQLVEQFYKDLLDYGFKPEDLTKLTGGIKPKDINKNAKIIIGNRQYLFNNKNLLPSKLDVIVCDECHQLAFGSSSFEFIEKIDAKIKIGCSGTLPRDKFQRMNLIGLFSKIFYTEDVVKLQNEGYLTKLHINLLSVTDSSIENNRDILFNLHSKHHYSEDNDIAFNEAYEAETNYVIKEHEKLYSPAFDFIEQKAVGNVLILFDRLDLGKNMFEFAKERKLRGANIFYIDGSIPVEERERIRAEFEKSDNNILFAITSTFSTGVNIKNLTNIVFMFQTKSASRVIQSIGRTLRLHNNKEKAYLLDICLNMKYSRKHLKERLKLYKEFYNKAKPDNVIKVTV